MRRRNEVVKRNGNEKENCPLHGIVKKRASQSRKGPLGVQMGLFLPLPDCDVQGNVNRLKMLFVKASLGLPYSVFVCLVGVMDALLITVRYPIGLVNCNSDSPLLCVWNHLPKKVSGAITQSITFTDGALVRCKFNKPLKDCGKNYKS